MQETHRAAEKALYRFGKRIVRVDRHNINLKIEYSILKPMLCDLSGFEVQPLFYQIGTMPEVSDDIKYSILDLQDLSDLNLVIVSVGVVGRGWFKGQKVRYILMKENEVSGNAEKISSIPNGHKVEYDRVTSKVRLCGPNVSLNREGDWVYV